MAIWSFCVLAVVLDEEPKEENGKWDDNENDDNDDDDDDDDDHDHDDDDDDEAD